MVKYLAFVAEVQGSIPGIATMISEVDFVLHSPDFVGIDPDIN